jgi:hypothetical protein
VIRIFSFKLKSASAAYAYIAGVGTKSNLLTDFACDLNS